VRVLFSAVFLLGLAQVGSAEPKMAGDTLVTAFRAFAESGGTITNGAQLSKALGNNPAGAALFPTVSALFSSAKGKSLAGLDWAALANAAKTMSPNEAASRLRGVLVKNGAINQTSMMAAFAVPVARTAGPVAPNTVNDSAAFNAIVCPAEAPTCFTLVQELRDASLGSNQKISISEAAARSQMLGHYLTLARQNIANCGSSKICFGNLVEGISKSVRMYGSLLSNRFMTSLITAENDFLEFRGNLERIALGLARGAENSSLKSCLTTGG
jgi:hypothetical protein